MIRILRIHVGVSPAAQNFALQTARDIHAEVIVMSEQSRNQGEVHGWFDDSCGRATLFVEQSIDIERWSGDRRTVLGGYKLRAVRSTPYIGHQLRASLWRVLLIFWVD